MNEIESPLAETPKQANSTALDPASDDKEPNPTWYKRKGWKFGDMRLHVVVSILYLCIAIIPLAQFVYGGYQVPDWPREHPTFVLIWATFVALAYPLWAWQEAGVFERWVRDLPEPQRRAERAYFSMHAGLAKNFWAAVLAIYTVAGLLGIALKEAAK